MKKKKGQNTFNFLYIEDDQGAIKLMKIYLNLINSFKSKFDSAFYLKDGIKKLENNNFDILFLDLYLPDHVDSPEATIRQIQKDFPNQQIIVISSYEDNEFASKLIEMGISDYLYKEKINASTLEKAILFSLSRVGKGLAKDATPNQRIKDADPPTGPSTGN